MLQTPAVIYCAVDALVPVRGKIQSGFDEFSASLDHAGIPNIWVTSRSRLQIDDPRRRLDHHHPFIAEGGCGIYLPEGYFHLPLPKTIRLGRFTCVPIAAPAPAASEALEELSTDLNVSVVPLRTLSPRELAQNAGLPQPQAELARHRDFDEIFFFAGASTEEVNRFLAEGANRNLQTRQHGVLWSLAVGASLKQCVLTLSKVYTRALRSHPKTVGLATPGEREELFPACDRNLLLNPPDAEAADSAGRPGAGKYREFSLGDADVWERVLESVTAKS